MAANLISLPHQRMTKRDRLWHAKGKMCHWCGTLTTLQENHWNTATRDHILPRYKGGTEDPENVVLACFHCNNRRNHEDARGLRDGILLGKYKVPQKGDGIISHNFMSGRVCLSGDEKKAIISGQVLPVVKVGLKPEEVLRVQRDQIMKALDQALEKIKQQELEIQELKLRRSIFWKFRKILAAWISPR